MKTVVSHWEWGELSPRPTEAPAASLTPQFTGTPMAQFYCSTTNPAETSFMTKTLDMLELKSMETSQNFSPPFYISGSPGSLSHIPQTLPYQRIGEAPQILDSWSGYMTGFKTPPHSSLMTPQSRNTSN